MRSDSIEGADLGALRAASPDMIQNTAEHVLIGNVRALTDRHCLPRRQLRQSARTGNIGIAPDQSTDRMCYPYL